MYSNRLQPAVQNLLYRIVRFFHPRSSCTTHVSANVFGGRKSLVKPVTWQGLQLYRVVRFFHTRSSCTTHISAHVQRITLNVSSCIIISGGRTKQLDIIAGFLSHHWLYEWFSQFHICGPYSVLSRSPSIVTNTMFI